MTDAQLDELEAKAIKGQAFHPLTVRVLVAEVRELRRDAEILHTLIYRTHACDLKFNKQGGVSSLSATFKSNTIPGNGMSEGVRRYLDAFMDDAALAQGKEG
ncbi:hypothetical protein [Paraburkholderia tropica]|uniref:hypothetical protein n=1 Tax=Paraburkholderia tropica TaxID=92647 RepID=UPI003D2D6EE1